MAGAGTGQMTCAQPGCQVAVSGKCLEGHVPSESCPHFGGEASADSNSISSADSIEFVDLPSGEALTSEQAAEVARDELTKVVVVAGPVDSGKTTILTSLFELFLEAPVSNFEFRGSRTLVGFERRCHDGRAQSGRSVAQTPHTSRREGVVFLHLGLSSGESGLRQQSSLLITDISGELFKQIRDSSESARGLMCLKRADHLCLALDGEKLVDAATRQVARNDCRSTLRSIVEAKVLPAACTIDVAITKWDVVVSAMQQDEALNLFIEETRALLSRTAVEQGSVRFFEVAARPTSKALPFAHGVPTLLRAWVRDDVVLTHSPLPVIRHAQEREMARFAGVTTIKQSLETRDVARTV